MTTPSNTPLALHQTDEIAEVQQQFFGGLADMGTPCTFSKGAVLIKEGDTEDAVLYLINRGWVRVIATEGDGKQIVIDEYGPGDYVGEMALDGMPRSASVIALELVEAVAVPRSAALKYLREHPEFALSVMMELIRRARLATANFKSAALKDVYGRIVELLQSLAVKTGAETIIPGRLTKADITRRIGASRDMVAIIMRDLTDGGYLVQTDRGLVIARSLPLRW